MTDDHTEPQPATAAVMEELRATVEFAIRVNLPLRKSTQEITDAVMADAVMAEAVGPTIGGILAKIEEANAARDAADRRAAELSRERTQLQAGVVGAINLIRQWCTPGSSLYAPGEATDVLKLLRKAMGDQVIDALIDASSPDPGDALAAGDDLIGAIAEHDAAARGETTAYLVLQDTGQIFLGTLDCGRASEAARNIRGIVVPLPVAEDYREAAFRRR